MVGLVALILIGDFDLMKFLAMVTRTLLLEDRVGYLFLLGWGITIAF
jgi:hypothetical protein